jgi:hypothetical protein
LRDNSAFGATAKGVVVRDVDPDGRAAGVLRAGDVIQEVNRHPVESVDTLRSALRQAGEKTVLLLVVRDGSNIFVPVQTGGVIVNQDRDRSGVAPLRSRFLDDRTHSRRTSGSVDAHVAAAFDVRTGDILRG